MTQPVLAARRQMGGALGTAGGRSGYLAKVFSYGPYVYWPLNELSGTVADNAEGTAARDGTYNGVALNDAAFTNGDPVGRWDGFDYCNIYSASLDAVFDPDEFVIAGWAKAAAGGTTNRYVITLGADTSNRILLRQSPASANTLSWFYIAGGTTDERAKSGVTLTDWFHMAVKVSKTADQMKAFFNGVQEGATLTTLGAWSGSLSSARCIIGADSTSLLANWNGWLAHWAVFPLLDDSAIADLATV